MAGTLNTSNYNFKKYAPVDTVSMLQTFNGNMDLIDSAIKDRANDIDIVKAAETKLETSVANINDGLNTTNKTLSALQVNVTSNKNNIDLLETETANLDTRVQILENGGQTITKLTPYDAITYSSRFIDLFKQGKQVHGFSTLSIDTTITADNLIDITSSDNSTVTSTIKVIKNFSIQGNVFDLTPNIGHVIGSHVSYVQDTDNEYYTQMGNVFALYNGTVTYIGKTGKVGTKRTMSVFNIDTVNNI